METIHTHVSRPAMPDSEDRAKAIEKILRGMAPKKGRYLIQDKAAHRVAAQAGFDAAVEMICGSVEK